MAAQGLGSSVWWGLSPAVDLSAVYDASNPTKVEGKAENSSKKLCFDDTDTYNVLLVGSGDPRHVMKTVASCTHQTTKQIHFYVLESFLECYARHILFWFLFSEPLSQVGLQERIELFLELFGNTLIRAQTHEYLKNRCSHLIRLVTDEDYLRERLPFMDLSRLKFKERDLLEGIFKFWRYVDPDHKTFDIKKMWDGRVRHHLGVRYDARDGVFDWDYHMRLVEIAPIINSNEYKEWRHTGIAFKLRDDAPYETPNRTLASGVIVTRGGEKVPQRGYWGDIVNSPYIAIGCECDNEDMYKKRSGLYTKRSCNVAEYNLLQFLKLTFSTSLPEDVLKTSSLQYNGEDKSSSKLTIVEEVIEEEEDNSGGNLPEGKPKETSRDAPLAPDLNFRVFLLPLGSVSDMASRAVYHKKFHLVYFSNSMVHHLNEHLVPLLREGGHTVLVAETAKYLLELKKEHISQYCKKVTKMAKAINFSVLEDDVEAHAGKSHLVFTRMKP